MKRIIYCLCLLLLALRLWEEADWTAPRKGEEIHLSFELSRGRAFTRKGYRPYYFRLPGLEDGSYEGDFYILDSYENFYELEEIVLLRREENFLRKYFKGSLERMTKGRDPDFRHSLEAILLGQSWGLAREEKQLFQYLGLSHLLAMSGLHVALLFLVFESSLSLFAFSKKQKAIACILLSSLYFFAIFVSPSFLRAYVMGIFALLAKFLDERKALRKSIAFSAFVCLMLDANYLLSPSFHLSYLAVIVILYVIPRIPTKKAWQAALLFPIVIQLLSLPYVAAVFGSLPILCFLSNLFLLPLGSFYILSAFFCFFLEIFHLSFFLPRLLEAYYHVFHWTLEVFQKIPYMTLHLEEKWSKAFALGFYIFFFSLFWIRVMIERKEKAKKRKKG